MTRRPAAEATCILRQALLRHLITAEHTAYTLPTRLTEVMSDGYMLKATADERTIIYAEYIIATGSTVRTAAARYGVSKSTVHKYITERLRQLDPSMYDEVKAVMEHHKEQRHLRGGDATRRKYQLLRETEKMTCRESNNV